MDAQERDRTIGYWCRDSVQHFGWRQIQSPLVIHADSQLVVIFMYRYTQIRISGSAISKSIRCLCCSETSQKPVIDYAIHESSGEDTTIARACQTRRVP